MLWSQVRWIGTLFCNDSDRSYLNHDIDYHRNATHPAHRGFITLELQVLFSTGTGMEILEVSTHNNTPYSYLDADTWKTHNLRPRTCHRLSVRHFARIQNQQEPRQTQVPSHEHLYPLLLAPRKYKNLCKCSSSVLPCSPT